MDYPHWLLHALLISIGLKRKLERNVLLGPAPWATRWNTFSRDNHIWFLFWGYFKCARTNTMGVKSSRWWAAAKREFKSAGLITENSASRWTLVILLIDHTLLFSQLATQAYHPTTSPRSAEGNYTATSQDLCEIHSCLPPCLQTTMTPLEAASVPGALRSRSTSIGRHREVWAWQIVSCDRC